MKTAKDAIALPRFRLPGLNGLRGISILMVIGYHLQLRYNTFSEYTSTFKILEPFISFFTDGKLGVNVFFVISGFLITTLLLKEEKVSQKVSLKRFYIRRTFRIFPAYYFYLIVLFTLQLFGILYISKASWLTSVTYTKYFNWGLDWYTDHAWSLSIEEQFYLIWPLLFLMGDKIRKRGALLFVLVVPIIKLALYAHPVEWITQLTIFHRIDSIALGCLIALHKNVILKMLNRRFEVIFFISLSVLFLLRYLQPLSAGYNLHLGFIVIAFGSTSGTIANLCIGVIVLYSVFGPHGAWSRLLNSKVLNYIGLLSYSLYLWQQLFLTGKEFWWSSLPLNLVFIAGSALFSYYCIEKPFLKLRDKLEKPSPIRKKVKSNSKDLALVFVAE